MKKSDLEKYLLLAVMTIVGVVLGYIVSYYVWF